MTMKDGDKFVRLINRRNLLFRFLYLIHCPELTQRDRIDWLDFCKANKN